MASGYKRLETDDDDSIKPTSTPPYQSSPNPTKQSPGAPPPYPFQDDSNAPPSYQGASQRQLQAGRPDTVIVYRQVVYGQQEPCEDWKTYYWAFIGLLIFFPFGIVACIKICEMNERLDTGDREGANRSAIQAKHWAAASSCVLSVGIIIAALIIVKVA